MTRSPLFRLLRLALLLVVPASVSLSAMAQRDTSYRDTPRYKEELAAYLDAGGRNVESFDKYYLALIVLPSRPITASAMMNDLGELPGNLIDAVSSMFKILVGLDPDKPITGQLEIQHSQRIQMYVPVKGAERLTPARMDYYHRFLFTDPLRSIAAGIAPAHERAIVAIQICDRSLLDQALRELEFVQTSFERIRGRAEEQRALINHQLAYYEQELAFLDPDPGAPEDPRTEWRNRLGIGGGDTGPPNIVEYLGLPGNRNTYKNDGKEYQRVVSLVNERTDVLNRWKRRIDEVIAYLDRNIPRIRDNQERIRQTFKPNACNECR